MSKWKKAGEGVLLVKKKKVFFFHQRLLSKASSATSWAAALLQGRAQSSGQESTVVQGDVGLLKNRNDPVSKINYRKNFNNRGLNHN